VQNSAFVDLLLAFSLMLNAFLANGVYQGSNSNNHHAPAVQQQLATATVSWL
jgi:hypothetical protein